MFPFLFPKVKLGRNLAVLIFIALAGIGSWLLPASSWSRLSTIGSEIGLGYAERKDLDLADRVAGVRTGSLPGRWSSGLCTDG